MTTWFDIPREVRAGEILARLDEMERVVVDHAETLTPFGLLDTARIACEMPSRSYLVVGDQDPMRLFSAAVNTNAVEAARYLYHRARVQDQKYYDGKIVYDASDELVTALSRHLGECVLLDAVFAGGRRALAERIREVDVRFRQRPFDLVDMLLAYKLHSWMLDVAARPMTTNQIVQTMLTGYDDVVATQCARRGRRTVERAITRALQSTDAAECDHVLRIAVAIAQTRPVTVRTRRIAAAMRAHEAGLRIAPHALADYAIEHRRTWNAHQYRWLFRTFPEVITPRLAKCIGAAMCTHVDLRVELADEQFFALLRRGHHDIVAHCGVTDRQLSWLLGEPLPPRARVRIADVSLSRFVLTGHITAHALERVWTPRMIPACIALTRLGIYHPDVYQWLPPHLITVETVLIAESLGGRLGVEFVRSADLALARGHLTAHQHEFVIKHARNCIVKRARGHTY